MKSFLETISPLINYLNSFLKPVFFFLLKSPLFLFTLVSGIGGFILILILTRAKKGEVPPRVNDILNAYLRVGDFENASEILKKYGFFDLALEMLRGAGLRYAEALTYLEKGDEITAAEILESLKKYDKAVEIYLNKGKLKDALPLLKETGDIPYAGALAEKNGDNVFAGRCFEDVELYFKAGECYAKIPDLSKCIENYEKALGKIMKEGDSYKGAFIAMRLAECYEKNNNYIKASEIFSRLGEYEKAALLAEKGNNYILSAKYYLTAGKEKEALKVASLVKEKTPDFFELMALIHQKNGNFSQAGKFYAEMGDFKKAGECFEKAGEFFHAGEMFVKAGENERAYSLFKKIKEYGKVAEIAERLGRYEEAAENYGLSGNILKQANCLIKAGKLVEAGNILYEQGFYDRALSVFQKVPQNSPHYFSCFEKMMRIYSIKGMKALAREKLEEFLRSSDVTETTVSLFYLLAEIYDEENEFTKSMEIYRTITSSGIKPEKAYSRLEEIKRLMDKKSATPPTPSAEPSALDITRTEDFRKKYQIIQEIGRGGMGIVYKARDLFLDRFVALKILPKAFREDPKAQNRMIKEAKAAGKLNHPNIVTVYEAGFLENILYIAMEFIEGVTLKQLLLSSGGKIPIKLALYIFGQVAKALSYAHSMGVIHGDIKPGNIMWTNNKVVKITDFGLAKALEDIKGGVTTIVGGTPYYMSPEQVLGTGMDQRSDIYSFGISFYECITGSPPFTDGDIGYHHIHTQPEPPSSRLPSLPKELDRFVLKCIAKKAEDRFNSMDELFEELRRITKSVTV